MRLVFFHIQFQNFPTCSNYYAYTRKQEGTGKKSSIAKYNLIIVGIFCTNIHTIQLTTSL